ncbi:DUF1156 domain-containing protein [Alicyclobacillus mali (ex Roth et al. 2021)]|uniref:DUF1156 domain-containing protein n=1 Tax=Alicyclobacillus mali (ex Roth et al. 2021) TaxID=1123961 RepID=UPI001A8E8ADF|nr:DUF1156 domain-containing protein [Alicyclobacillus mali (ex Roth et al. 2021)]
MSTGVTIQDRRLIEAGFPCHQVGAETQRERDTGQAPPTHRLHVWWARRPLTPSRAAILGSILPADTDPDWFLRQLGIEKTVAIVNGQEWTLVGSIREKIESDGEREWLTVDKSVLRALEKEQSRREKNRGLIARIREVDPQLARHPVVTRWESESQPLPEPLPPLEAILRVRRVAADPAHVNERIEFRKSERAQAALGSDFKWDPEDLYGYDRAYAKSPSFGGLPQLVVLDPTAGGGSIPFEAFRLGHRVIANDLNPVAAVILHATLEYPAKFGDELASDIEQWGNRLIEEAESVLSDVHPIGQPLSASERAVLSQAVRHDYQLVNEFDREYPIDYIYCRQVTCPHCGGEAPLLNTCWLSKNGDKWAVRIVPDGKAQGGKVHFETYRLTGNKGPNGEDPDFATVKDGVGLCVHCKQAVPSEEIRAQARGESPRGKWRDRLYCVVAVRYQPKLDKNGQPIRYKSGKNAGEIRTEKVVYYRPPNEADLAALEEAERRLMEHWDEWNAKGLIPTEAIPEGHKTSEPRRYGMTRWCDMFTPRQLLGHLTLIEELNRLKPQILAELGEERGKAVVTYLQFAIDKGLDYNSKQTRWHYGRGVIVNTFGRHDFSLKWTFAEMVLTGPNSGIAWGLTQVIDAYKGVSGLLPHKVDGGLRDTRARVLCGTAAYLGGESSSVDLICMDPPYYNNVQYAELSDYFYVWQRRTLRDLYPGYFSRPLTNKDDEAVANPARDGSSRNAKIEYERSMLEIFSECRRVLKNQGIMCIMFTHKAQEAWEALTKSLIETGWTITASVPVDSEASESIHQKDNASAASSIFLTCRKRDTENQAPSVWSGFGGTGVAAQIREAVREALKEFEPLRLNPVDEMVASYGRALQVLSQNWPVLDGDEMVSPIRAMNEASAVVAQYQIARMTNGRIRVEDLSSEAAMALTLFGIFGTQQFPYDEALSLSRSLNMSLETKTGGYRVEPRMIGINNELSGRRRETTEESGYYAPLVKKGSKLRLALPEERNPKRLQAPQTEWDMLQGLIMAYREGDIPGAHTYLQRHAEGRASLVLDLLAVWASRVADDKKRKEAETILYSLRADSGVASAW